MSTDGHYIIGVDEVGTGAYAGPIAVCATLVSAAWQGPSGLWLPQLDLDPARPRMKPRAAAKLRDSKMITRPKERESVADQLNMITRSIVTKDSSEIDRLGLGVALSAAFREATLKMVKIAETDIRPYKLEIIIDGLNDPFAKHPDQRPRHAILCKTKADSTYPAVAAASVLAKVHRDGLMRDYSVTYPAYYFHSNKGYPSGKHLAALAKEGICPIHRKSYKPIKAMIEARG